MPATNIQANAEFLEVYDKYSPVMYGIAVKLTSGNKEAEAVLVETFEKLYQQSNIHLHRHCILPHLVRLTVRTAYHRQFNKLAFKIRVSQLPPLHKLLLGDMGKGIFKDEPLKQPQEHGRKIAHELRRNVAV